MGKTVNYDVKSFINKMKFPTGERRLDPQLLGTAAVRQYQP